MGTPELTVDGAVATNTLRRPEQANRLTPDDLEHMMVLLAEVDANPAVLVLLLRGTGKYFCSGYDIASIGGARTVDFAGMVDAVEHARPVTIAVLHGGVYGGATDLALACDFRVGVAGMQLRMPAARLGLHYYPSGLRRYVSRLGLAAAKRLFLLAEAVDADDLRTLGFLDRLVPPAQLDATVQSLADALAAGAPLALRGMKQSLDEIARGEFHLSALREREALCAASADLQEGRAAMAEKRTPRFTGR